MTRQIIKIEYVGRGNIYFPEGWVWVYLEGSRHIPDYTVSAKELEVMVFGC